MTKGGILIIEDDYSISNIIEIGLQYSNIPCFVCNDPEKAEELVPELEPSVIVMDYWVNSKSILEFIHFLRVKTDSFIEPALILMSADSNIETIALKYEISHFLQKPFDLDQLISKIYHSLQNEKPWLSRFPSKHVDLTQVKSRIQDLTQCAIDLK